MKCSFLYIVQLHAKVTRAHLDMLIPLSKKHYDAKCRSASEEGGRLHVIDRVLKSQKEDSYETDLSTQELDLWCKIMEGAVSTEEIRFHAELKMALRAANREYERLNSKL